MAVSQPSSKFLRLASVVVALLCFACGGSVQAITGSVLTETGSGITIGFEGPLTEAPPNGLFPILVKINNGSSNDGEWLITTSSSYGNGVTTHTPVELKAGKSASVWIYAPMAVQGLGGGAYRQLQVTFSGTKVAGGSWSTNFSHSGTSGSGKADEMHFPGLSLAVAGKGELALQERFKKDFSGAVLDSTRVDLAQEIPEWRALCGVGQLWMTDDEWSSLSAGSRAAVMDWLTLGGRVVLLTRDDSNENLTIRRIPPAGAGGQRHVGAGRIVTLRWDGISFPIDRAMNLLLLNDDGDANAKLFYRYHSDWKLPDIVGVFSVHAWLIFGFIVAFGVLVGPVNLFYLAGPRQRHRMFWTTPVISLAGGALLVLLMVLQDGIGGYGARRVLAIMSPTQRKTAIVQEQVSRTGVLLGSSFNIPEPVWISQVSLSDPSVFSPFSNRSRQYSESGDLRSGEWFSSRSVQGQLTQAVRPSRGGVEFYPAAGGAPAVVSSLAAPLREIFVVDEKGQVWKTQDVVAGVKKTLSASDQGEFDAWLRQHVTDELGPVAKNLVSRLRHEREHVFAISGEAESFAVPTLKSIRWNNQGVVFAGPYERR